VVENSRPPVAVRVVRPYESEDDFLHHEFETIGRTSILLVSAPARPVGVILRFEVALSNGTLVMRGEGRVLGHKETAFRGEPYLALRFTRLDPKSKAVVDRATAMREASKPAEPKPMPAHPVESPIAEALSAPTPTPGPTLSIAEQETAVANARAAAREKANAVARENARRTGRPRGFTPIPPSANTTRALSPSDAFVDEVPTAIRNVVEEVAPASSPVPPSAAIIASEDFDASPVSQPLEATAKAVADAPAEAAPPQIEGESMRIASDDRLAAPPNRDELLARLRKRSAQLPPERVQAIFASRRT
jgi:hypothetical protein